MRIAVDMDDTLVDFFNNVIAGINREYGTDLKKSDVTEWKSTALDHVFPGEQTWWDWVQRRDWLWTKAPAVPGAIGAIHTLRHQGHHIELLTSKPEWAEWVVWAWLGKWRPAVQSVTIVFKEPKWKASNADVLVDDGPHNVEPWVASGRPAILFDQPWNQRVGARISPKDGASIYRARDWSEVLTAVDIIETVKAQSTRRVA